MKFSRNDIIVNVKVVDDIKILTSLTVIYVGELDFYPFADKKGEGYHLRYHPWEDMALDDTLLFRDIFITEAELDDRFILLNELPKDIEKNIRTSIERDKRINEIFED